VSQQGLTVLVFGPSVPVLGRLDVTLEALVYGAVAGARVMVLVLAFGLYSAVVDPDEVLHLFRRISLRSALTASLATRLVPLLAGDAERLGAALGPRDLAVAVAIPAGLLLPFLASSAWRARTRIEAARSPADRLSRAGLTGA